MLDQCANLLQAGLRGAGNDIELRRGQLVLLVRWTAELNHAPLELNLNLLLAKRLA